MDTEFERNDKKMERILKQLHIDLDSAEGDGILVETSKDGSTTTYSTSQLWVEVAKEALELSRLQAWFDKYDDTDWQ